MNGRPPPGFFSPTGGFHQPFYGQHADLEMRMLYDIYQYKVKAETELEQESYAAAEKSYSKAIEIVRIAPPACYNIFNELPKLLSNRSLVFSKLRNFQAAASDAHQCVQISPDWTKGYWRMAQALKGLKEEYHALSFLVNGYNLCRIEDTDSDAVMFLTDILSTTCQISDDPNGFLDITKPVCSRDCPTLVSKVMNRLASSNHWEAVSLMVTGIHSGPTNHFEEIADHTNASGIAVGALISSSSVAKMKKWGVKLAIALLKNGASVQDMEIRLAKPAIHIGLDIAIQTGKADFMKFLFEHCVKTMAMKDAVDNHGNTVLHLLVQSGKINTTLGETILRLLINNGCNTNLRNADQKTPIQYLRPDDQGYILLQSAEKQAVEDLKQVIFRLKEDGNRAHRECKHDLALDLYSQAINLCERYQVLRSEMAVLLTNRSAVFSIKGNHQKALNDALKAIEVDKSWNKGHWRKGQVLRTLEKHKESFDAFLDGYNNVQTKDTSLNTDKINFLMESIICLQYLNLDADFFKLSYNRLRVVSENEWNLVVGKLSKAGEWLAIRIIVLGSNQMVRDFQNRSTTDTRTSQCFEGLGFRVSYTGLTLSTIFPFLRRNISDAFVCSWITQLLILLLESGGFPNFLTFVEDQNDTPLHAAVKFSIMAGNVLLLNQLPMGEYSNVVDRYGDSAFHIFTKKPPIKNVTNLIMVAKVLLEKGICVTVKDRNGKIPIEYLKRDDSDPLYALLKPHCTSAPAIPQDPLIPLQLREQGNAEYKQRNFPKAIELYSKAIQLTNKEHSFDLARLHGNRMECFLRMKCFREALDDALESVSYDGHWYKAHFRVGKAQSAIGNYDAALKAFTNAFNALDSNSTETVKKEILFEFTIHHTRLGLLPNVKTLNNVTADLWAKTAYDMVLKKEFDGGCMAFGMSTQLDIGSVKVNLDLKPLCDMHLIGMHAWIFELIHMLLLFGSDHQTISLQTGDTYLGAVVRMTLLVGLEHVMVYILDKIAVPKQEMNIVDSKGNSALHTTTKDPNATPQTRLIMIHNLLQRDINPMIKNSDGKLAVEYLPRLEFKSLDIIISRMNAQQEFDKKFKQQLKKQEEQQRIQIEKEERQREKDRLQRQKMEKQRQQKTQQQQREAEQARKKQDSCETCDRNFQDGIDHLNKLRTGKAYHSLAGVLKHRKDNYHKILHDRTLSIIIKSVANTLNPDIPERLAKIPVELYEKFINGLAELEKYKQMDIAVTEYRKHHGDMALRNFATSLNVAKVIRHRSMLGQDELLAKIISNMLESGAVLEKDGKMCILGAIQEEHFNILCTLFERGADPAHLSLQQGDTPLHAAMSIALERDKGNFSVFNHLLDMFESNPEKHPNLDPAQQDVNGDGLFHVVAKMKYNSTTQKATELLVDRKISAFCRNKEGKLPKDYLMNKKNDRRLQFFRLASVDGPAVVRPSKKSKNKSEKIISQGGDAEKIIEEDEQEDLLGYNRTDETEVVYPEKTRKSDKKFLQMKGTLQRDNVKKKIEEMIYDLPETKHSIFNPKPPKPEEPWKPQPKKDETVDVPEKTPEKRDVLEDLPPEDDQPKEEVNGEVAKEELDSEEEEGGTDQEVEAEMFDNLEWEVECTSDVWKTLRDKHVLPELKQRCIKKICQLARGEWRKSLCKVIQNVPNTLHLFEAKLSKGGRIIWELAVAFSPRLSETAERRLHTEGDNGEDNVVRGGRIYSEIIRVWDVVFSHDHIYRSVQNIIKSHNRGEQCIIQRKLKGEKHKQFKAGAGKRVPMIFTEADAELSQKEIQEYQDSLHQFFPPASSNETEYHILKFYSFSSNLVHHVLQNIDTKVDFPFRVTDLEHAIINLQSEAPILLLGRSGTGKTTCCLYRLWTQFIKYWDKASEAEGPLLPRFPAFLMEEENEDEEDQEEDAEEEVVEEGVAVVEEVDSNDEENEHGQIYDHLHQVFITKNAVLCSEVQKNFRELSHACEVATQHVQKEENPIPSRLQDIDDYQYPLFITSKKLMLMLDASLGKPYFFARDEEGNLKTDIEGWTDGEGTLSILPLLAEDSDEEEEGDDQFDDIPDELEENAQLNRRDKVKRDARREVTYDVFSYEVWPKISKKYSGKYHPSLIWTEIMSFIRGSFEALSKPSGTLSKDEYFELGKKRASNFSGQREHVYELYKRYDHFKRQKFLFDETDLVRHIYNRLKQETEMQWVIHQIFVDETQDFTQAELCLLLRICQNPNQMFLTGDTAQSIMRGIAFRFNDLKSLFYYARQSMHAMGDTSTIEVPKKVHQLTHNYRSHAGILSLACSILDLMVRFFPESFDRLQKDQGLFHGPPPVLLESCSFSDLAVLLRGNRRKTSHIEFGAHQAILVVDDAARENLPEELQLGLILTIYEAKGLEFDDILLYNFFKDSQAGKEWRVVTEYLEEIAAITSAKDAASKESLVEIDAEVLQQGGRPRPLKFDPNHHKVLNSELKHLYTAVTRARVNVWIFDEDVEKRAPMFEYFKARKLVKRLTSVEVDDESVGGVFAEQSSSEDWVRRGEDFMKHALYEVAAKCFGRGGDSHLVKVAHAHQQALVASRTKSNHQRMRDEFLLAAQQFLDCSLPSQAAKCLVNARERELVAFLYEKIGQLERAAETYRRLKKPIESSRCYEQLGMFNLALDTLCENEFYEMAIETIVRYEKLKKRCEKEFALNGSPIPTVLCENAPGDQHTQERLSHKAAIQYHRSGNEIRMLKNLERMPKLSDRIDFLKTHGYYDRAAEVFEKEGKYVEAARLYLTYSNTLKAIESARRTVYKDLLAECLLVHAQIAIRSKEFMLEKATEDKMKKQGEIIQNLQEAIDLSIKINDHDTRGEACFLKGQLTQEITDINESWGAFNKSLPRNEAGQLECMDWMVYNSPLDTLWICKQVVIGMGNLFSTLQVFLSPNRPEEKRRAERIYNYYGLKYLGSNSNYLKLCPVHKPRALKILNKVISKADKKKSDCEVLREQAKLEICRYLLERGQQWYGKVDIAVNNLRQSKMQCPTLLSGRECQEVGCRHNHTQPLTKKMLLDLLDVDILLMKLEHFVISGAKKIQKNIPIDLKDTLKVFIPDFGPERPPEFSACKCLLQDLIPRHYLPWQPFTRVESKEVRSRLVQFIMKDHIKNFLETNFFYMEKYANTMSSDFFVKLIFMKSYFSLEKVSPQNILSGFERDALKVVGEKPQKLESLGFLVDKHRNDQTGNKNIIVSCIARRFYDAYEQLIKGDAMESLIKFTKFIIILGDRNKTKILPEYHHFLMWLEFYTTVGLCLCAKLNETSNVFFLPASYISTVHFIDSSFMHNEGAPTFELVQRYRPRWNSEPNLAQNRVQRILSLLCGSATKMNLIRLLFKYREGKPMNYAIAERLLVLCLTCICNMGEGMLYNDLEANIMENLSKVSLPEDCPPRLVKAIQSVQAAEGQADVAGALKNLLRDRCKEEMKLCTWGSDRYGIRHEILQKVTLFNSGFNNSYTFDRMSNSTASGDQGPVEKEDVSNEVHVNETEMDMEEKLKWEKEQEKLQEEEVENRAACIITRSIRRKILLDKYPMVSILVEEELIREKMEERLKVFKDITIDDTMCGVCGVHYQTDELTQRQASIEPVFSPTVLSESEDKKKNPFSLLFTGEIPQAAMVTDREIPSEDLYEERKQDRSQLRKVHEGSDQHNQKNLEFVLFKSKYKKEIAPPLEKISEFIRKYKLDSTKEVGKNFANMSLDIQRLVCSADEVQTMLQKLIETRVWEKYGQLLQKSKEMEGSYNAVMTFVETRHKELQESEMAASKVKPSSEQHDEDWDEDLLDIEPVVSKPKKKSIPKGRGRGRKGRQED